MNSKRDGVRMMALGSILAMTWTVGIRSASAGQPRAANATVGNKGTRQSSVATNGAGGYAAHSTVTGPAGNVATRQSVGAYNPATQSYSRSGIATGPNGNSTNFNRATQLTSNGVNHTSTRTGPNGNSGTANRAVTLTPHN